MKEMAKCFAKQYLALTLSEAFNKMLKELYPTDSVFLNYVQPFLVLPLFKVENEMNFYEMEKLVDTDV